MKKFIIPMLLIVLCYTQAHAGRLLHYSPGTCDAPCLNAFQVINILYTQATGTWTTVQSTTDNIIQIGTDTSYGMSPVDCGATASTSHSCDMTSLTQNTDYHARACSTYSGVTHCSPDVPFKTEAFPEALISSYIFDAQSGVDSVEGYTITPGGTAPNVPTYVNTVSKSCSSYGLNFTGTGNGVATASGTKLNNFSSMTVDFTLYCTGYGATGYGRILSIGTGANNDAFYINTNQDVLGLGIFARDNQGNSYSTLSHNTVTPVLSLNQRQNFRVQYDATAATPKFHVYKDVSGSYVEQGYSAQPTVPNLKAISDTWNWGNRSTGDRSLACVVDNIRVYNSVTPTSSGGPVATTPPTCDNNPSVDEGTGYSTVPTIPADATVKTVCASGCNYTTIQAAINASAPGWTIRVKAGTYLENPNISNKNCTQALPCTLEADDANARVIGTTGKPLINGNYTSGHHGLVLYHSAWWIVDGLEVEHSGCKDDGVMIQTNNATFRNNYVHNNGADGYKVQGEGNSSSVPLTHDILIESSIITHNGDANYHTGCTDTSDGWYGLYVANHQGNINSWNCGAYNITFRRNKVSYENNGGFQLNSQYCAPANNIHHLLFENNEFYNTNVGAQLYVNITDVRIQNNTFVITALQTRGSGHSGGFYEGMIRDYSSGASINNIQIVNNIFYSTVSTVYGVNVYGMSGTGSNETVNYNLWDMATNNWHWQTVDYTDFAPTAYKSRTGWDTNGIVNSPGANPHFISSSDFHLNASAPASQAIDAGTNTYMPVLDYDKYTRPYNTTNDMGCYEYH